jgi:hypothetical protein
MQWAVQQQRHLRQILLQLIMPGEIATGRLASAGLTQQLQF